MSLTFSSYCLDNLSPDLLKEFPEPKSLLNNTISRSLGVSDLSKLIQYNCTEHGNIKVRVKITMIWGLLTHHITEN